MREDADVRYAASVAPEELPWPLTFYFLGTEEGWVNVGFEMGLGAVARDALERLDPETTEVTPSAIRHVTEHFFRYRAMAQDLLEPKPARVKQALTAMRRTRRVLEDPEALALFADDYRMRGGARGGRAELADLWGVDPATIWRWKQVAIQRGHLDQP